MSTLCEQIQTATAPPRRLAALLEEIAGGQPPSLDPAKVDDLPVASFSI